MTSLDMALSETGAVPADNSVPLAAISPPTSQVPQPTTPLPEIPNGSTNETGPTLHPLASPDILPLIFSRLPAEQVLTVCALVCRLWNRVCRQDTLWKTLLARSTGLSDDCEPIILPPPLRRGSGSSRQFSLSSSSTLSSAETATNGVVPLQIISNHLRTSKEQHHHHMSWFRFALENRLARILLGMSRCFAAESPARHFPRLDRQKDPLLWSLFPGKLYFNGLFEQWDAGVLVDIQPNGALPMNAAITAASNILSSNPLFPTIQPPEINLYRGDLLITKFEGRKWEGYHIYPTWGRRDTPPSITRLEGEIISSYQSPGEPGSPSSPTAGEAVLPYPGRIRYRELEVVRNRGIPIIMPTPSVIYDSMPSQKLLNGALAQAAENAIVEGTTANGSDSLSESEAAVAPTLATEDLSDDDLPIPTTTPPIHGYLSHPPPTPPLPPSQQDLVEIYVNNAVDQTISFAADLPAIYTSPSSLPLGLPFGERFCVGWDMDWMGQRDFGRTEFVLAS